MSPMQRRVYAAAVRAELVARGTELPAIGPNDTAVRAQLAVWIPLLQLRPRTKVRHAETLVIPLKEQD